MRLRDPGHAMAGLACTEPAQKAGSEAASLEGGPPSQLAPCKRSPSWCVRGPHRLPKPPVMAFAKLGRRTPSGMNNPPLPEAREKAATDRKRFAFQRARGSCRLARRFAAGPAGISPARRWA